MPDENGNYTEEELKSLSPEELNALQKQNCIFCKIAKAEMPSSMVYDDDLISCFLDINPASKGHVLIVPKEHHLILPQVPVPTQRQLFIAAQHMSQAAFRALQVAGTTIFIANGGAAGQRAYHFILHVIPRDSKDGLFATKPKELPAAQVAELRRTLAANLGRVLKGNKLTTPQAMPRPAPQAPSLAPPASASSPAERSRAAQAPATPVPVTPSQAPPAARPQVLVPNSPLIPAGMRRMMAAQAAKPTPPPASPIPPRQSVPDERAAEEEEEADEEDEGEEDGSVKAGDDDEPEEDADVEHPPEQKHRPAKAQAPSAPPSQPRRSSVTNPALDNIANMFLGGGR